MKKLGAFLFLLTGLVVLSAASCGSGNKAPSVTVSELTVTTGLKFNNQPENTVDTIAASTEEIYLSGKIQGNTKSANLRVRWFKLPNSVVATEDFDGRGSTNDKFDYDKSKSTDYFASRIIREGVAWATGDYKVETYLNNIKVDTQEFKIVPDSEAEVINSRNAISRAFFGSKLNDEEVIAQSETSFSRSTDNIYIQLVPGRITSGSKVEVVIRHLKDQINLNNSSLVFAGEDNLVIPMARSRFGKFWSDGLWAIGVYEVVVKVNSVTAGTYIFTVR